MFTTNSILAHASLIVMVAATIFISAPLKASPVDEKRKNFLSRLFKKPKIKHPSRDTGNSNPNFEKQEHGRQNLNEMIGEARELETQNRLPLAAQKYESVLAENKNVPFAHHRLAVILDKLGRSDEAHQHYIAAARLAPDNADIYCDYGYSLYLQGQIQDAAQQYQQALQIDRNMKRAYNNLGMLYAISGQFELGRTYFGYGGCDQMQSQSNLNFGMQLAGAFNETAGPKTRPQYHEMPTRLAKNNPRIPIEPKLYSNQPVEQRIASHNLIEEKPTQPVVQRPSSQYSNDDQSIQHAKHELHSNYLNGEKPNRPTARRQRRSSQHLIEEKPAHAVEQKLNSEYLIEEEPKRPVELKLTANQLRTHKPIPIPAVEQKLIDYRLKQPATTPIRPVSWQNQNPNNLPTKWISLSDQPERSPAVSGTSPRQKSGPVTMNFSSK